MTGNGTTEHGEYDYMLQLSNGESENSSINPYEEDINVNKAISGRVRISHNDKIRYGFSFYKETTGDNDDGISYDIQSIGTQFECKLDNGFALELEYVMGAENAVCGANIDRFAYTSMFSYSVNDWLTPYLRVEYLEPD